MDHRPSAAKPLVTTLFIKHEINRSEANDREKLRKIDVPPNELQLQI